MGCIQDICKINNQDEESISTNVDFLCPKCGKLSPEILNINIEKKNVLFNCQICTENEYFSKNFFNQIDPNDNTTMFYCIQPNKILFKEYRNNNMNSNDNNNSLNMHKSKLKLNKDDIIKIKKKNERLKKIIRFNKIMINTCEQYNNNYFYLKSLKNISLALKKEKSRDSNDLKFLLTCFKNEIGKSKKAIDNFNDKKQITIDREEESLFLIDKKLNDENIECISQIKFNQLKELDLSENEIVSIEPLCNLNLPFLEFLNLSHNKIKNIKPLGEINLKKLKYLLIHNNEIIDINFLQESNFPKVEIVSIENNSINEKSDSFKELVKLYKKSKKLLVTNKEFGEIKKKYNFEYNENTKKIEIENKDGGDSMLKEIFIIIIHKNKNKIKELKLKGNKIEDPSILNRIQFNFLTKLDLSVNSIKNLNFLKQIKAKNLEELYLNNNDIIDISLLENIRNYFNRLEKIVLYENKIDPNEPKIKNLKSNLENKGVQLHLVSN